MTKVETAHIRMIRELRAQEWPYPAIQACLPIDLHLTTISRIATGQVYAYIEAGPFAEREEYYPPKTSFSDAMIEWIQREYDKGDLTLGEIAEKAGTTNITARFIGLRLGRYSDYVPSPRGVGVPRNAIKKRKGKYGRVGWVHYNRKSKLSDKQREKIVQLYEKRWPLQEIADFVLEAYGVTITAAYCCMIGRGKRPTRKAV